MRHSVLVLLVLLVLLVFLAVSWTAPLLAGAEPSCVEETQEFKHGPYYDPEGYSGVDKTADLNYGPYCDPDGPTDSGCSTEQSRFGPYCDPEG